MNKVIDKNKKMLNKHFSIENNEKIIDEGIKNNNVSLKRKVISKIKISAGQRNSQKTINVEIRKKRIYINNQDIEPKKEEQVERIKKEETKNSIITDSSSVIDNTSEVKMNKKEPQSNSDNLEKIKKEKQIIQPSSPSLDEKSDEKLAKKKKQAKFIDTPDNSAEEKKIEKQKKKISFKNKSIVENIKSKKIDVRSIAIDDEDINLSIDDPRYDFQRKNISKVRKKNKLLSIKKSRLLENQDFKKPIEISKKIINLQHGMIVQNLSNQMSVKSSAVIKKLLELGVSLTANQFIDPAVASIIVEEFGNIPRIIDNSILEKKLLEIDDDSIELNTEHLKERPPVVVIMGHVDHGKTSLLDYIRRTNIATSEAGGITQKIGAYHVKTNNSIITFIDTPGHEAFEAMRERGTKLTDIVILVVAADDGVMPQTIEAIKHIKSSNLPIIVAINKIDKQGANTEKIKIDLSQIYDIVPEEWGGDVMFVEISAKTGYGVNKLLESILLQSEMLELKAPQNTPANGIIIESHLDKGYGITATILVQNGTLKKGNIVVVGETFGKIRILKDDLGNTIKSANPSIPVKVICSFDKIPEVGEKIYSVKNEKIAKEIIELRKNKYKNIIEKEKERTTDEMFSSIGRVTDNLYLNIIIKADSQGTLEAISDSIEKIKIPQNVTIKILTKGIGDISESDINTALSYDAIIIAFNTKPDPIARNLLIKEKINIKYTRIIYEAINEINNIILDMIKPDTEEKIIGKADVKNIFKSRKFGSIAGCVVLSGFIRKNKSAKIIRNNEIIFESEVESLRKFKDDVNEAKQGTECGIGIKNFDKFMLNDKIEIFEIVKIKNN